MTELYTLIERYLVEEFGVDAKDVRAEATFQSLELDSLSMAELSVILEENLGVKVADIEMSSTLEQAAQRIAAAKTALMTEPAR